MWKQRLQTVYTVYIRVSVERGLTDVEGIGMGDGMGVIRGQEDSGNYRYFVLPENRGMFGGFRLFGIDYYFEISRFQDFSTITIAVEVFLLYFYSHIA